MSELFRALPSVDALLKITDQEPELGVLPRAMVKDLVNAFLDQCREGIRRGRYESAGDLSAEALTPKLVTYVLKASRPHFRRVLNGTGVVVHTNLGRSLLCEEAIEAVAEANRCYSNLEFDLETGRRGSRYSHVEEILCRVSGAEAALVVNNNAAAVMLILDSMAKDQEVIVSRGQLVEIGGSFRIPDVMAKSGATLVEVGATNRTHVKDYENAITENTAALMRVHTSNFRIVGFTKEVTLEEMVELGDKHGLPVIEDLGSGNFSDFRELGLGYEPTVREVVEGGAAVCSFSGDKVLGGPQAGVIVGKKEYIDKIKKNPMNRALRIDKMTLAALEATLRLYLDPDMARRRIPTLNMIMANPEELASKAIQLKARIKQDLGLKLELDVIPGVSRVGGGAFPERDLPTTLVRVSSGKVKFSADLLKERLLETDPPLIGRIEDDLFCLDARTIQESEFPLVASCLGQALAGL